MHAAPGIAGEERRDVVEVEGVIDRETAHPRQAAHINGQPQRAVGRRSSGRLHWVGTVAPGERDCQGARDQWSDRVTIF